MSAQNWDKLKYFKNAPLAKWAIIVEIKQLLTFYPETLKQGVTPTREELEEIGVNFSLKALERLYTAAQSMEAECPGAIDFMRECAPVRRGRAWTAYKERTPSRVIAARYGIGPPALTKKCNLMYRELLYRAGIIHKPTEKPIEAPSFTNPITYIPQTNEAPRIASQEA